MALFKKKIKNENSIEENGLKAAKDSDSAADESGLVRTTLIFPPDWELTSQEKYVYMYYHQQLPLLEQNQVSIKGVKLLPYNEGFVVVAL
ncbi:SLAP domain-containing protein [Neobacillus sp. PS3-34]|uniref:SLAP domain-containing protein n=1 Tax=Neobacillus sp. PS3-34 TaxID=3070678 RepID=UPI0027DFC5C2|nr:SLAP domain-containing protein [Neobacillus sp. PS3-34]WML46853.1 SLAP domain-containing protein [Neobacillus sp. PS3-34]